MPRHPERARAGISIVCVFNNPEVLQECLDRSIRAYSGSLEIQYIPVDNTNRTFSSAGSALNHGTRQARHELVAFAHQDVYLHSLDRLAAVGLQLLSGGWGLLGANGVTTQGQSIGRLRDRVQLIGKEANTPVEVDSVDEVLFMASRDLMLSEPLSEDPKLAWHAYAVELSLRLRTLHRRVGAVDMAITHNSLTINLDKLDVAHQQVGETYLSLLPIQTTCGVIRPRPRRVRELPVVRDHRWRARWLRQSLLAVRARQRIDVPIVLSDIRHEIDLLHFSTDSPLHLLNLDHTGNFAVFCSNPLQFTRFGRPVIMTASYGIGAILSKIDELSPATSILLPDLGLADLEQIRVNRRKDRDYVVGIQSGGIWLLSGPVVDLLPAEWSRPQGRPLGSRLWNRHLRFENEAEQIRA